ncbi:MAG: xanthine dehydrogenase family protein molybdopterin-binding subunit [Chromatiales bacterium]|nr:xanthine dehydrogenase family protein molybdopterin-binding subunit [Chromatiales bacterium]
MALSRRKVIVAGLAVAGGLGIVVGTRRLDDGDAVEKFAAGHPDEVALNAWIRVAADGWVTFGIHRAEMGQGVTTSLAMLLAEELDADWSRVRYEFTPVDNDYFNFGILAGGRPFGETEGRPLAKAGTALVREAFHQFGLSVTIASSSTVDAWDTLRAAAAEARARLLSAAGVRFSAPAGRLQVAAGVVSDPVTGQQAGFGELAADAVRMVSAGRVPPKAPESFRLLGTSPPRLDIPARVTGAAVYAIDQRQPGMLFGTVCHAPRAGGRIGAADTAAAAALPGVERVVPILDRGIAVLANDTWTAFRAAALVRVEPAEGDQSLSTPALEQAYRRALDEPGAVVFRSEGDAAAIPAGATTVTADYALPFLAHACMEPMNCAALFADGRLTLWAPTQAPTLARDEAAKYTGLDPALVDVRMQPIGGGFGRRADCDFVVEAAVAAMAVPGRMVQLTWSRADDIRHDMLRPMAVGRVRGAVDGEGRIASLDYTLVSESCVASNNRRTPSPRGGEAAKDRSTLSGAIDHPYAIPVQRFAYVPRDDGMPTGFWRSVSGSINPFLLESFVDELAAAAGADPVEFRRRHLEGQSRHLTVLDAVTRLAGWGTPTGPGVGRGIAIGENHESVAALVVEVGPGPDGRLRARRISCAVDCRFAVHPDAARAQIVGGILDGYSAALQGRVTLADGAIVEGNFDTYPWIRMADVPEVQVELLTPGGRPAGIGEVGVPLVAPALTNAIFAATGQRVRELPLAKVPGPFA